MRAMLASIGVASHVVAIFSGDRNYVRPEWPSPQQFNHAIIAVSVKTSPGKSSALDHARFGSLLMFDPTDEHTPLGELPLHEQGSLALIVAPAGGALVRMPVTPASHHAVERTIDGTVTEDGSLSARVRERSTGAFAIDARGRHRTLGATWFQQLVQQRMSSALPRARIRTLTVDDESVSAPAFGVAATVEAGGYAQAQTGLLVLTLPFEMGGRFEIPADTLRRTALLVEPRRITENIRLQLPAGFGVDEMPEGFALETPFGRYSVKYSIDTRFLVSTRVLEIPLQTIRPEQYAAARAFFGRIRQADAAPIVLARKSGYVP